MPRAVVNGRSFDFEAGDVERALATELPDPVREHYVVIDGRRWPPKQVLAVVTGLDRGDFTTHQARRVLVRLGFPAARRSSGGPAEPQVPRDARTTAPGVEALRPFVGKWVAVREDEVLVAADSMTEVVAWLARHDLKAQSLLRVPEGEGELEGVAPQ